MDKHCKGCVHHHNAKQPNKASKYNDWCVAFWERAKGCVVYCKIMNKNKVENE